MPQLHKTILATAVAAGICAMGGAFASAATYDVGPAYAYTTLSSVPWSALQPGDVVNIHWRAAPYKEHILLSQSGTAAQHIVVHGVPDPATQQLPVLDSDGAVEAANINYCWSGLYGNGAVMVSPRAGFVYPYIPSYIDIENLKIIHARAPYSFQAPDGTTQNYARFTAGINVERGQNITIRGCELTDNALGLFVNSKYNTDALSANILIEHNDIHHNGVSGDASCHNCYTEAAGVTYQYNHIGPVITGSVADAIKDRSSNLVIRYNNIESGPSDCLDLIEAQSDKYIATLPNYDKTWIYGNTFYNGPTGAAYLINYGGLDTDYSMYRKGTLYFYNNTVVNQAPYNAWWRTVVFVFPYRYYTGVDSVERVDCRNNIFASLPVTPGAAPAVLAMMATDNTPFLDMTANYVSPGTQLAYYTGQGPLGGLVTGWAMQHFGDANGVDNPGFVNPSALDFRLAKTAYCIDKGTAQNAAVAGLFDPQFELMSDLNVIPRPTLGAAIDLGAHENSGLAAAAPPMSISSASLSEGNSGVKNMIFTVTLASPSAAAAQVSYTTANGTAAAGSDYTATSGTLIIPAGQTSATIAVPILGDTVPEPDETFTVNLSNAVGATLIGGQGVGTIVNDDSAPVNAPVIYSFTPAGGAAGTVVTITGQYLTGATGVYLHDIPAASYTVVNDTTITFVVPAMAAGPAKLKVITPAGKCWAVNNFVVN
ncbi:hypothetical protein CCAX7_37090 [Capsulimonas corticalis]|uniref:Uncharacterized protein n=1 Tax=Capsulimonas corticalis TaxID=2219043 RepID=A0A402D192_9BACT|nr:Calx-beta domain-containing protein [Capsulimonas corticalis]BDI31658.1 hypothetical protein CCAX7_37090 [Capsulimonas corticalis]